MHLVASYKSPIASGDAVLRSRAMAVTGTAVIAAAAAHPLRNERRFASIGLLLRFRGRVDLAQLLRADERGADQRTTDDARHARGHWAHRLVLGGERGIRVGRRGA